MNMRTIKLSILAVVLLVTGLPGQCTAGKIQGASHVCLQLYPYGSMAAKLSDR
jgi:hypothetical protein